jgi:histidinol-phosphate aminotransferase
MITVGNGSVELIRFLALACFGPQDPVVIAEPTFGEYRVSLEIAGARPLPFWAAVRDGFRFDIGKLGHFLVSQGARGLFLCNPNNPTGAYLSRSQLESLSDASPECLLVLDEAYLSFVEEPWDSLSLLERGNLVLLRSLTKDYALGGLRLGYALGPPALMRALRTVLPPWSVNSLAQEAGILALRDQGHLARSRRAIAQAKEYLLGELRRLGLAPLPTATNFLLVPVGDASAFRLALLRQGILVRDCTSFGLPEHIRISLRTLPECQRLVAAMRRVLRAGPLEQPHAP